MARIDDMAEKELDSIFAYAKEGQDFLRDEDNIKQGEQDILFQRESARRQEDTFNLQKYQSNWFKEVERKNQIQREIDRKSDRKFLWFMTLVSAVIGALTGAISTIIFERFFK